MASLPKCSSLGRQCQALDVTLLIDTFDEGDPVDALDHTATWLLGHTETMTFRNLRRDQDDLLVDVVIRVPCKHLKEDGTRASCKALGFSGRTPTVAPPPDQPRQLGRDRFRLVEDGLMVDRRFAVPETPKVSRGKLPVVEDNPCEGAPCRTSDNRRGAACCRDLQLEILCRKGQRDLEALIRSRKAPYLCKVEREGDATLEAEVISACAYLEDGGVACTLHGRTRKNGEPAKPKLCFDWPPKRGTIHPGCVFRGRNKVKR